MPVTNKFMTLIWLIMIMGSYEILLLFSFAVSDKVSMTTSMNPPSNPHPLCDKPFNIEKRLLHDLLHSLANQYGEHIQVQSQTITSTLYGAGLMKRKCMDLLWLLLVIGSYQVLMLYAQLLAAEVLLAIAASFNALNFRSMKFPRGVKDYI